MKLKRPHILMFQRRRNAAFSMDNLLAGGAGVESCDAWIAMAPHLGAEVVVDLDALALLDGLGPDGESTFDELVARFDVTVVEALVANGLLISDQPAHAPWRERNDRLTAVDWWGPAAVAQVFGRWQGVDIAVDEAREGRRTLDRLMDANGLPPAEADGDVASSAQIPLPPPKKTALDDLLAQRATCRNFDDARAVPLLDLGALLHRVFGAQSSQEMAPGAIALKKNSPSGGGLHPVEAYLLVQRVEGLQPGLFHYQSVAHALKPLPAVAPSELAQLAHELVAGQAWFANAPVLVLMAARFQRNFWKYRNHPKAWRVIQLDAGHLSQNLYITATEMGYGAFITAAINDDCAERAFSLDGLSTGAIAVCGFGPRSAHATTLEFDPQGRAVR